MLTEEEIRDDELAAQRAVPSRRPLCVMLRYLRKAAGCSLAEFERRTGVAAVVVGAYERGYRIPPLSKLDAIFAAFGYQLAAIPTGIDAIRLSPDIVAELRAIADQLEARDALSDLQD